MSDHDWATDPDIVVRTQMAISVYLNQAGELVIRQKGHFHPDEDVWVVIAPDNVPKVLAAMEGAIGIITARNAANNPAPAKPRRRRRGRQRDNAGTTVPVTVAAAATDRDSGLSHHTPTLLAAE